MQGQPWRGKAQTAGEFIAARLFPRSNAITRVCRCSTLKNLPRRESWGSRIFPNAMLTWKLPTKGEKVAHKFEEQEIPVGTHHDRIWNWSDDIGLRAYLKCNRSNELWPCYHSCCRALTLTWSRLLLRLLSASNMTFAVDSMARTWSAMGLSGEQREWQR